jgi:TonB-linked SusC/RagA family outer membrane protein
MVSFLSRLSYSYKGKYLASVSFRADGSSKFFTGHKWGVFPAASIGWRISEESFMKDIDWMTNLKFRLGHGVTGNNSIPQYSYMNTVNSNNYVLGEGNGSLISGMSSNSSALGNPDITWEQTGATNMGIDIGVLNNRINLTVDLYNSNTIRLLLEQPAMAITGHETFWNNIGEINNKGIELEVQTTNISNSVFSWKTSANISMNKNTLLNYGNKNKEDNFGERNEVYRAIVGQPAIQFFGYQTDGVWTTFDEVAAAKAITDENGELFNYTKFSPIVGGLKVKNTNGDNKIDSYDRVVLGDPFPDYTWGITNSFTYKDFDLSFMFQGVQGGELINGNPVYNDQLTNNKAYITNRYVSPMFPGDGKTTYSNTTAGSDLVLTDYTVEDATYTALRDLSIGYILPKSIGKLLNIKELRAFFSATNLIYLMASDYRGVNPEYRNKWGSYRNPMIAGYQRGVFPLNRTYTIGVNVKL